MLFRSDDVRLMEQKNEDPPIIPEIPENPGNLVKNGDMEIAAGNSPQGWFQGNWGTNRTEFSYDGHAVTTTILSIVDGDAKWAFASVPVVAGEDYLYSDRYKATIGSTVIVEFCNNNYEYTYLWLGPVSASTDWNNYQAKFTVPVGATQATVYHLIDQVGTLTIDDVSLVQMEDNNYTPGENGNYIVNGSMEESFSGWYEGAWGGSDYKLEKISDDGHSGTHSLKATITRYQAGDVKWLTQEVNLVPGKMYEFSVWYKSNIEPKVWVCYTMSDGSQQYGSLSLARATSEWKQYKDTFIVPENTISLNISMAITGNGWVATDDYRINDFIPEDRFNQPLLTIMFDDGFLSNISTAMPMLDAYEFKSTHCYMTERLDSPAAIAGMLELDRRGHEIGNHTISHVDLTTLTAEQLYEEVVTSKNIIERYLGHGIEVFVSPYGSYNSTTLNLISQYYPSHRSVDEGYNFKDDFNVYNTKVRNVFLYTTAAEIDEWVNEAKAGGYWLILLYHEIADNPGIYGTTTTSFAEHLSVINDSGITVKTYSDALNEVLAQI